MWLAVGIYLIFFSQSSGYLRKENCLNLLKVKFTHDT